MTGRFVLVALLGALFYLDRTAAFQVMLHRPLIVATVSGWLFGNVGAGVQVGIVLELLYIARLPVGASIPPDDTGAAIFGGVAAAAAASTVRLDGGVLAALLTLSVVCAEGGKVADRFVRRVNGRIAALTMDSVDRGDTQAVEHGLMAGLLLFGVAGAVLALLFSGLGLAVARYLVPRLGPAVRTEFAALLPLLSFLGAASVFSCSRTERTAPAFYLTMATAFLATTVFRWAV